MTKNVPKIKLAKIDPLQDRFEDGTGDYWGVARLIDDTKNLKPFNCPLAALDLSHIIWKNSDMVDLAWHCKKVNEADLEQPIILSWDGSIADGRHRVIKAIISDKRFIKAVRMHWKPAPCGHDGN